MSTVTVGEYVIVNYQLLSSVFSQLRIHLRVKTIYILFSELLLHFIHNVGIKEEARCRYNRL